MVKPEVKFLSPEITSMGHFMCFFMLLENFYVLKNVKKHLFAHKKLQNVIYDTGSDLNIPQIYFNGP